MSNGSRDAGRARPSLLEKALGRIAGRKRGDEPFLPADIQNEDLALEMIPPRGSPWHEIARFSLTFSGYRKAGSFNRCTEVSAPETCTTLSEMRARLFFEARSSAGSGKHPDRVAMDVLYGLLDRIREKVASKEWD